MQVTKQKADQISFRARLGEPGKTITLGWYLDLADSSRQSFSGRLTGDAFDSSAVDLQFTRWKGEGGAANESQPVRAETNRASSAAGSRR